MTTNAPEAFGGSFGAVLITVGGELAPHATCLVKCFVEGTPVWMADGTYKPIEEVKEGDFVLSFDETIGKVVASRVLATSARESDVGTVSVTVATSDGKRDVIECTPEHPLFVPGKGWTQAGDLGIGTSIVTRAGPNAGKTGLGETGTAKVVSVVSHASRRVTVCNMTVENTHTYFVGTMSGGIWVHNTYGPGPSLGRLAGKAASVSERGLAQVTEHLAQFGTVAENSAMISRLQDALTAGRKIEGADLVFYTHELSESVLMKRGMGYADAHAATMAKYGNSAFSVYHPEVIKALPESFNSKWRSQWGIP